MEISKLGRNKKFTNKEIIELFKMVHGEKYDYSQVNYKGMTEPVVIICNKHGKFKQRPVNHKSGRGCPKCGVETRSISKTKTTKIVINEFVEVHGNKYDYSKVQYINALKKIEIICPIHGTFQQTPASHKTGVGCPKCGNAYCFSNEEIIQQFTQTHGDIYDYSLVDYKNNRTKIKIICPEHGIFEQEPYVHKTGSICPKCLGRSRTKDEWIVDFRKKHKNKYDYSKFIFEHSKKKTIIICSKHGEFLQSPSDHINGYGCPSCGGTLKLSQKEVIESFIEIHRNTYDYSLVNYINNITKVKIICPKHGVFEQLPLDHKKGNGCPQCSESKGEKRINDFLRKNKFKFITQHKFPDCKYKQSLPFDFYLPNQNILIEYHGEQHYHEIPYFHKNKQRLIDSRKRDAIKKTYCEIKGINLFIIPYYNFDDIEKLLSEKMLI